MKKRSFLSILLPALVIILSQAQAQQDTERQFTLYDTPPRWLVDMPTAGTLPRGHYDLGLRFYNNGGGIGYCNIGLSSRFMLGISYGAEAILANQKPLFRSSQSPTKVLLFKVHPIFSLSLAKV